MKLNYAGRRAFEVFTFILDWVLIVALLISLYNIFMRKVRHEPLPMLFGRGYAVTVSGSMEPTIAIGDIVWIKQQPKYDVGDIIVFVDKDSPNKSLVTHRVVGVTEEGYITKGDNNNTADSGVVEPHYIKGAATHLIHYFGATLLFIQKPIGMFLMLLLALLLIELPYRIRTRYREETMAALDNMVHRVEIQGKEVIAPDRTLEFNDGSYRAPQKTKRQIDFERELDWRRRKKQKRKIFVPDEGHWDID